MDVVVGWNIYKIYESLKLLVFQNCFGIRQGQQKDPIQKSGAKYSKIWKKKTKLPLMFNETYCNNDILPVYSKIILLNVFSSIFPLFFFLC